MKKYTRDKILSDIPRSDINFEGDISLGEYQTFENDISFNNCYFQNIVDGVGNKYEGKVSFEKCTVNTSFNSYYTCNPQLFKKKVSFDNSSFCYKAFFKDCVFNDDISFKSASFSCFLFFKHNIIDGKFSLKNASLEKSDFKDSLFKNGIEIGGVKISQLVMDDRTNGYITNNNADDSKLIAPVIANEISNAVIGMTGPFKATIGKKEFDTKDLSTINNIITYGYSSDSKGNTVLKDEVYNELAHKIALSALKGEQLVLKNGNLEVNTKQITTLSNLPDGLRENTFKAIEERQHVCGDNEITGFYKHVLEKSFKENDNFSGFSKNLARMTADAMQMTCTPEKRVLSTWTEKLASTKRKPDTEGYDVPASKRHRFA